MKKQTLIGLAAMLALCAHAKEIPYEELVRNLHTPELLSILPQEGVRMQLYSSYNRRSQYDKATGKYVDWDWNFDYLSGREATSELDYNYIGKEGDDLVFVDHKGPGVLVLSSLITFTLPDYPGPISVELDGVRKDYKNTTEFAREMLFTDVPALDQLAYFQPAGWWGEDSRETGKFTPVSFIPVAFNKSLKITGKQDTTRFYLFKVMSFPRGTVFGKTGYEGLADNKALQEANQILKAGAFAIKESPKAKNHSHELSLPKGAKKEIAIEETSRAITKIKLGLPEAFFRSDNKLQERILRGVVLKIHWDQDAFASVEVPIAELFGSGPGYNEFETFLCKAKDGNLSASWFMPFASGARLVVENQSEHEFAAQLNFVTDQLSQDIAKYMRFHCKWTDGSVGRKGPDRWIDFPLLIATETKGRFCGIMLNVWSPTGGWWGEGDEKFFVDGEKFPSTYGTGSEDYLQYTWCGAQRFSKTFTTQSRNDFGNTGHISVFKAHVPDDVPFQKHFQGFIEKYSARDGADIIKYRAVPFWYQEAGKPDRYATIPSYPERVSYYNYDDVAWSHYAVEGAIEAEEIAGDIAVNGGKLTVERVIPTRRALYSKFKFLEWTGEQGNSIAIPLKDLQAGSEYEMQIGLHPRMQFADPDKEGVRSKFVFEVNGAKIEANVCAKLVKNVRPLAMTLDMHVFIAGQANSLKITMAGAKNQVLGLDYILIKKK
jgi:hypothetical protein